MLYRLSVLSAAVTAVAAMETESYSWSLNFAKPHAIKKNKIQKHVQDHEAKIAHDPIHTDSGTDDTKDPDAASDEALDSIPMTLDSRPGPTDGTEEADPMGTKKPLIARMGFANKPTNALRYAFYCDVSFFKDLFRKTVAHSTNTCHVAELILNSKEFHEYLGVPVVRFDAWADRGSPDFQVAPYSGGSSVAGLDDLPTMAFQTQDEASIWVEEKFGEQNFRVLSEMRGQFLYIEP